MPFKKSSAWDKIFELVCPSLLIDVINLEIAGSNFNWWMKLSKLNLFSRVTLFPWITEGLKNISQNRRVAKYFFLHKQIQFRYLRQCHILWDLFFYVHIQMYIHLQIKFRDVGSFTPYIVSVFPWKMLLPCDSGRNKAKTTNKNI